MTVRTRWVGLLAAGLVAATALGGCGAGANSGDRAEGDSGAPAAEPRPAGAGEAPHPEDADEAPQREAEDGEGAAEADAGEPGGTAGWLFDSRSIIYTGEIAVQVADVDSAADQAVALATRHGGFVGVDRRSVDEENSVATMVLRIPSENFTAAVGDLGRLGDERWREIETEDVTEEVVDLETRIATARASVERTRELLEQADSIADIVSVEEELSSRETALARLQARQRTLADLTTLSTITVQLLGPEAEEEADEAEEDEPVTGFLAGLDAGWSAFTGATTAVLTAFGAVLPFLVALAVPATAATWWARRRRLPRLAAPQEGRPPGVQAG